MRNSYDNLLEKRPRKSSFGGARNPSIVDPHHADPKFTHLHATIKLPVEDMSIATVLSNPDPILSDDSSETSDPLDLRADEGWQDVEPDNEEDGEQFNCLYSDAVFPTLTELLTHCKNNHDCDLVAICRNLGLYVSPSSFHG